jgi:hypothetical protein
MKGTGLERGLLPADDACEGDVEKARDGRCKWSWRLQRQRQNDQKMHDAGEKLTSGILRRTATAKPIEHGSQSRHRGIDYASFRQQCVTGDGG